MATTKQREPLGTDPLTLEEDTLRSMVRGETAKPRKSDDIEIDPHLEQKPINRTGVYLTAHEMEALRVFAFHNRRTKTDIMRSAIREYVGLD